MLRDSIPSLQILLQSHWQAGEEVTARWRSRPRLKEKQNKRRMPQRRRSRWSEYEKREICAKKGPNRILEREWAPPRSTPLRLHRDLPIPEKTATVTRRIWNLRLSPKAAPAVVWLVASMQRPPLATLARAESLDMVLIVCWIEMCW